MSVSTIFKAGIRDAGNISDYKMHGSLRSVNKFDAPIPKGKYEDLFANKEFESTVIGGILPKAENSVKLTQEDKNAVNIKKYDTEDEAEKPRKKRDDEKRSKNKNREDREKRTKDETLDRRKGTEQKNEDDEDEFFKSLEEKRERRRRKLRDMEENIKNKENERDENETKDKKRFDEHRRNEKDELVI